MDNPTKLSAAQMTSFDKEQMAQLHGPRNTVFWASGRQYTGEWRAGKREGYGSHIYKNGDKFEGEWKNDMRHGFGSFYKLEPDSMRWVLVYCGEWAQDKFDGFGTRYFFTGEKFEGQFFEGKRSGFGVHYFCSGDVYTGEWLDDQRSGKGIMLYANGNRYEGMWLFHMKHGPGVYYYVETKRKLVGEWFEDSGKCGSYDDLSEADGKDVSFLREVIPDAIEAKESILRQARTVGAVVELRPAGSEPDDGADEEEDLATADPEAEEDLVAGENELLGIDAKPPIAPLPQLGLRNPTRIIEGEVARLRGLVK